MGTSHAHHGEILQGVFEDAGRLRRALVTLPCPLFASRAGFSLSTRREITVVPRSKFRAAFAARMTLDALGLHKLGGKLVVSDEIPVCRGFGSSTSDISATVRAVVAATRTRLSGAEIARLAVRAEGASDPLMFDHAVLFAQRDGVVVEDFCAPFPRLAVLGFTTGNGRGVETLAFPPARYSSWEIEAFRPLRGLLRRGLAHGSAGDIGAVATASARLNQRHLRVRGFDELESLRCAIGAAGIQVAHSGDIAGFLFDPDDQALADKLAAGRAGVRRAGIETTWTFCTGSGDAKREGSNALA